MGQLKRVGPLTRLDRGQYKGIKVEDIIRHNPSYFMYCVKEWLDISPLQALLFEEVSGGGIIPDKYIRQDPPPPKLEDPGQGYLPADEYLIPGFDEFDPEGAPEWYKQFKKEASLRGYTPEEDRYYTFYRDCLRRAVVELTKLYF